MHMIHHLKDLIELCILSSKTWKLALSGQSYGAPKLQKSRFQDPSDFSNLVSIFFKNFYSILFVALNYMGAVINLNFKEKLVEHLKSKVSR